MQNLFRPPTPALSGDLKAAMNAVLAATPLSRAHAQELPHAVRDLSRLLTQDRSQLAASYWINKRLLTAYCRYFLPWNLLRLSWLLPNFRLSLSANDTMLDLGSGPLTMPIALWLAFPDWRNLPLTVVCSDVAPAPLNLGREIFRHLAPDSPWNLELRRGPLDQTLNGLSGTVSLITAANVLNEFRPSRETPLPARLEALTRRIAARLAPGGRFLAVEPGTRLGGKLMALTRQAGFSARLVPESPCPHWQACPMLARDATGWCHFSHIAGTAPESLAALTKRAGLGKDTLSLSCLLLRRADDAETARAAAHLPAVPDDDGFGDDNDDFEDDWINGPEETAEDGFSPWPEAFAAICPSLAEPRAVIRILSDPIRLPGLEEPARYACSGKGLVLAHNALRVPSGAATTVNWPAGKSRDPKTGALVVTLPPAKTGGTGKKTSPASQGQHPANPARKPRKPAPSPAPRAGRDKSGPAPAEPGPRKDRETPPGRPRVRDSRAPKRSKKNTGDHREQ